MTDSELTKERTALNLERRARFARDGQTAMDEYQSKRRATYENAERLTALRQARDAAAADIDKAVVKKANRRKAVGVRTPGA